MESVVSHFGFERMPFSKEVPSTGLYGHNGHLEAVARMGYLISEQAIGVIFGECGSGKTVAFRAAVGSLEQARHSVIYLSNPMVGPRGLYAEMVLALGDEPRFHKAQLISQVTRLITKEKEELRRSVTIAVDEAHLLDAAQLEELRLLTNADMDSASPFSLILIGQPSLKSRLRLGTFRALDQRISLRYSMPTLSRSETASYIAHHLSLQGRSEPVFSDDATARIHEASRGLPRSINNLARQALIAAYSNKSRLVDEKAAIQAIAEVERD